ncbi:hypothetical protein [Nocardia sp. alder85J]|uniref:hypothetical protein n=1 Tax=Nocardia sp. alder85J TaxID=2862949 RepID=UPI001CD2BCB6|nr:hypothetical protein [Nocardia sp. alder85J]MCX4098738.1 hypothetical protein [Nocardia sp. alder85J]
MNDGSAAGHSTADHMSEFTEELRLLAETLLERVEPVLRRAAADDRPEWDGCGWCPLCATAALVRGEHHEAVATIAAHGTAIVTVLREALAGVPVDPVAPDRPEPAQRPASARYQPIPVQIKS